MKFNKATQKKLNKITNRLEELEEKARANRDKYEVHPLSIYLDDDEAKEYNKLQEEFNKRYDEVGA